MTDIVINVPEPAAAASKAIWHTFGENIIQTIAAKCGKARSIAFNWPPDDAIPVWSAEWKQSNISFEVGGESGEGGDNWNGIDLTVKQLGSRQ